MKLVILALYSDKIMVMDMFNYIHSVLVNSVKNLYSLDFDDFNVEYPKNESFGDYASNIALILSKILKKKPMDVATEIVEGLSGTTLSVKILDYDIPVFSKIYAVQPGFINFVLSNQKLNTNLLSLGIEKPSLFKDQKVIFEYTDPNPFKVFHIGHLMSNSIGESLSRIYQYLGADLKRVNYQGDVGLHVAKSIWGVLKLFDSTSMSLNDLNNLSLTEKVTFLGKAYALGAAAYEENSLDKDAMKDLNLLIYMAAQDRLKETEGWVPVVDYKNYLSSKNSFDYDLVKQIYYSGRAWSLEYFETLYSILGTHFDDYYFESKVGEYGLKIVMDHIKDGIFELSDKAVIFNGENVGLHTRVFVNSYGLPTYEAKDLGLAPLKYESFKYDKSFIITASEVNEYFKVVLAAMKKINPTLSDKTTHLGHGVMRFKSGKMSSRTGDVITGVSLIEDVKRSVRDTMSNSKELLNLESTIEKIAISAIKYSILKQSPGKDIIFDKDASLALTGDTGPYLMYTYARINSVLEKSGYDLSVFIDPYKILNFSLEDKEISLLRHLYKFDASVIESAVSFTPNTLANYLFELAQRFNSFYATYSVLDAENEEKKILRILILYKVANTLSTGLNLLGIEPVSRM